MRKKKMHGQPVGGLTKRQGLDGARMAASKVGRKNLQPWRKQARPRMKTRARPLRASRLADRGRDSGVEVAMTLGREEEDMGGAGEWEEESVVGLA